jgi:hypothetical protein
MAARRARARTHHVVAAPVEEVEVVVVDEVGRVEDALLGRRHVAELLAARRRAEVGRVERREAAVVALRRCGRLVLECQHARLLVDVEAGGEQLLVLLLAGRGRRGVRGGRALVLLAQGEHAVLGVEPVALGDEPVELQGGVGRAGGRGGGRGEGRGNGAAGGGGGIGWAPARPPPGGAAGGGAGHRLGRSATPRRTARSARAAPPLILARPRGARIRGPRRPAAACQQRGGRPAGAPPPAPRPAPRPHLLPPGAAWSLRSEQPDAVLALGQRGAGVVGHGGRRRGWWWGWGGWWGVGVVDGGGGGMMGIFYRFWAGAGGAASFVRPRRDSSWLETPRASGAPFRPPRRRRVLRPPTSAPERRAAAGLGAWGGRGARAAPAPLQRARPRRAPAGPAPRRAPALLAAARAARSIPRAACLCHRLQPAALAPRALLLAHRRPLLPAPHAPTTSTALGRCCG